MKSLPYFIVLIERRRPQRALDKASGSARAASPTAGA
jgi:hypothetical protein